MNLLYLAIFKFITKLIKWSLQNYSISLSLHHVGQRSIWAEEVLLILVVDGYTFIVDCIVPYLVSSHVRNCESIIWGVFVLGFIFINRMLPQEGPFSSVG
jgi:hypothetical protein